MNINYFITILLTFIFPISLQPINFPVILTLSIPTQTSNTERIDNSLFRWVTSGGVDLISIHTWTPHSEIDILLQNITAVIFMGQSTQPDPSSQYYIQSKYIYDSIKLLHDSTPSKNIPLLALGNDLAMLLSFEGGNISKIKQYSPNSIVFESFDDIRKYNILSELDGADFVNMVSSDICPNKLDYVISKEDFNNCKELNESYYLIASARVSHDDEMVYVSIVEGKKYPFFGLSFHPEKINFDKGYQVPIPDSQEAVKMARMIGNSFLFYARMNNGNTMTKEMKITYDWIDPYGDYPEEWYGTYQYFFKNE